MTEKQTSELIDTIENAIEFNLDNKIREFYMEILEIVSNCESDIQKLKYLLLKKSNETYDRFNLIILDAFLETSYQYNLIDECLVDNKRIPSGIDYSYGNYFEKEIIKSIKGVIDIESTNYKKTDAIIKDEKNEPYILEIKCSFTDTSNQIERYQKRTGIQKFITINGHQNSIAFNQLSVFKTAKKFFEYEFNNMIKGVI